MTNKYMNLRIVWLLPGWGFSNANGLKYWEPIFTGCQRAFRSVIFITTGVIHSYYAEMFSVHSVGQFHWKKLYSYKSGYGARGCALLSPAIVPKLLKLKPQLIISTGFNLWTILAAFFKKIGHWKLVVLWDGSSPTIDATDDPIRLLVRKWTAKHTDAFITNSMGGTHYFQDSLHVSKERVFRRFYLIADVKSLTNNSVTSLNIQEGQRPRFLCVGKLISRKGIYELLNAWSKLEDLSPERGSLWIVGNGREKNDLIEQARTLGLRDVYFVNDVEYASLGSWYQACDVFVFPTLEDIWGVVVSEAMAFGKPILCSKFAGAAELVHHGESGFIFNPRAPDELADFMFKLVNSPELVRKFGQKSREIMKSYTPAIAVGAFQEVIEQVAAEL